VLKTEGRLDESVAAYRRAIQQESTFGEAYWSLANLKIPPRKRPRGDAPATDPSVADTTGSTCISLLARR
jgi:hypothetical protein